MSIAVVLSTVGSPPTVFTCPLLTRMRPDLSRLITRPLFALSPKMVSCPVTGENTEVMDIQMVPRTWPHPAGRGPRQHDFLEESLETRVIILEIAGRFAASRCRAGGGWEDCHVR